MEQRLPELQGAVSGSEGLTLTGANIAVGGSAQVYGAAASGGNFYTKLTGSDYRLGFDGTNYTVTRLSDNTVWTNTDRMRWRRRWRVARVSTCRFRLGWRAEILS